MTFEQAEQRAKEIAAGKAYGVTYGRLHHSDGMVTASAQVWIDGRGTFTGATYKAAFDQIGGTVPDESPTHDDGAGSPVDSADMKPFLIVDPDAEQKGGMVICEGAGRCSLQWCEGHRPHVYRSIICGSVCESVSPPARKCIPVASASATGRQEGGK